MKKHILILLFAALLISRSSRRVLHAPELVRGELLRIDLLGVSFGYVDGGNVQFGMIGYRKGDIEVGSLFRVSGENIDNDNMPISYRVEHRNSHKANGCVLFREHERKLCWANEAKNLPCR